MHKNAKDAIDEYNRKVEAGEIERAKAKDPIEKAKANPKSLRAAINAKCWDCSGYIRKEVINCPADDCPLWGVRPWVPKV